VAAVVSVVMPETLQTYIFSLKKDGPVSRSFKLEPYELMYVPYFPIFSKHLYF